MRNSTALLIVCAGAWLLGAPGPACAQVLHPDRADFLMSNTPEPPPADATGWQSASLPDAWRRTRRGEGGIGWYRVRFELDDVPDEAWAVLIDHRATAYVNGVAVGGTEYLRDLKPTPAIASRFFVIEPSLLRPGANELLVGVQSMPDKQAAGVLGLQLGTEAQLRPRYLLHHFVKVALCQISVVVQFVVGALFGALWLQRRRDTLYGWFAVTCLVWAVRPALLLVRDPTRDDWIWSWLVDLQLAWMAALSVIIAHRFFQLPRSRFERFMLAYAIVFTFCIPLYPQLRRELVLLPLQLVPYYFMWIGITQALRTPRAEQLAFAIGALIFSLAMLYDTLWVLNIIKSGMWITNHIATFLLSLILAWILIHRFVQALRVAENTGAELARQVEEKSRELEATWRSMEEMRQRQAVVNERERIMRDLHDGLGGHLVAALALSQGGATPTAAVTQTLREALDDLRMVIDSLDPVEGDLLVLLGTVRGRLEPRLAQQGIRFDWRVQDIPAIPGFGPDKALQVLRIVQEAIANVLKHAGARTITVTTGTLAQPPGVFVQVADDGAGFVEGEAGGRGLSNMRLRAQRIGGTLEVDSAPQGTRVRLSLPLAGAAT